MKSRICSWLGLLSVALVVTARATPAVPCPWVTDEEREMVRIRVYGSESEPGTPEGNATRFYSNREKTEYVDFNYDEAKAGEGTYTLEDPLTFVDGRKVKTAADWPARRQEILKIFEREVYGRLPPKPTAMAFEVLSDKMSGDRFSRLRVLRQYFRADKTGPFIDWFVAAPRHAKGALLLECYHKKWFDPWGEWLAAKAASPVWEFLVGKGLGAETWPEPYSEELLHPPFGYVRRTETHGLSPYDWKWAIDFANQALK